VVALAREALRQGHTLRFRARGASMRPQVEDGAVLEVVPRAPADARLGDVVLYAARAASDAGGWRLVAHRVVGRRGRTLVTRGDSAARVDLVDEDHHLGLVAARVLTDAAGRPGRVRLDGRGRRWLGLFRNHAGRFARAAARRCVLPLRVGPVRRAALAALRLGSRFCAAIERRTGRVRRGLDVATAALLPTEAKDAARRRLYARASVRDFTALDENVVAGLTLIEEVLLARHPLQGGRVLVLGCGPGRESVALARRGCQVTGLDRDEGMLERARALAAEARVELRFVRGEADAFALPGEAFDAVVAFSGLYNMLLPSTRRIGLLRCAREHLAAAGRVFVTFLSDYAPPGRSPPPATPSFWRAVNEDHERGDMFLRNEAVHVFPHGERIAAEARAAGLEVLEIFRDQRAYDRETRQVRGYAVMTVPSCG
jgi:SAM-dependent methyltransferase